MKSCLICSPREFAHPIQLPILASTTVGWECRAGLRDQRKSRNYLPFATLNPRDIFAFVPFATFSTLDFLCGPFATFNTRDFFAKGYSRLLRHLI